MSSACAADNVTSSPLRGLFVIESTHHALPDPSADLRVPSSESQFATSHLGHFQLTARLWEALSRTNAVEPDQRGRDAGVRAFSLQIGETSVADGTHMRGVMPYAVDPKGAEQLWTLSERLLDLKFL